MIAMTARMTGSPVPIGEYVPEADQRLLFYGRSWADFEALLEMRGDTSRPRMAYLDGVVEIMSPSRGHESIKSMLGRALEQWCVAREILVTPVGSWLLS